MARPAVKFANIDSPEQREQVFQVWKTHHCHYTRMRAHAIILSSQGYQVRELVDIFGVNRNSVSSWIDRFESHGVDGLEDEDRPGAPRMLDEDEQELVRKLLNRYPNRPSKVRAELEIQTGKEISDSALRKYAKRLGMTWKRLRRSLRKKRDERAFQAAKEELSELLDEPDLEVVYFDEAGFSLKGVVPYGWQPIGERIDVPVTGGRGSNIQVLGFESQTGLTDAYLHKGYVTTETVIEVFDDFCEQVLGTTVVVLDNASCHTSEAFWSRLETWAARGLFVYHLPPYSPELNAIEMLWKKLKYQLIPHQAWERFTTLLETVTGKLCELGQVTYLSSLIRYAQ